MRLSWKPAHSKKSSIIEIRLTNSKNRARIVFHHTNLYESENKLELKEYWSKVISNIEKTSTNKPNIKPINHRTNRQNIQSLRKIYKTK